MKRMLLALAISLSLAACSVSDKTQAAEKGVASFHQAMNAGRHSTIYDGAAADMKSTIGRDDFVKLLAGLNAKLGAFKSGKTLSWKVNATTGGTYVTLSREAQFDKGPGTEEFVFRMDGERAVLAGYHVTSNVLLTS